MNDKEMDSANSSGNITIGPSITIGTIYAYQHDYVSPVGKDEFPIMASTAFYVETNKDEQGQTRHRFTMDLDRVRRCGFNVFDAWMKFGTDGNKFVNEMARFTGLKIEAGDTYYYETVENVQRFMEECKDLDAIALWKFKDEPSTDDFKSNFIDTLKKPYKCIYEKNKEYHKDTMVVTNLLGGAVGYTFNNPSVEESYYVKDYITPFEKNFAPGVWSYDVYPIQQNAWGVYIDNNACQNFYGNLIFYACKTYGHVVDGTRYIGRPFWAYVESMTMKAYNGNKVLCPRFPKAKEEYMRFEAFTALAFGAQGIKYWTYGDRDPNASEVYFGGLMDKDGYRTEAWYAAQKVNLEIHALKDVFLGCRLIEFWFACNPVTGTPQEQINWFTNIDADKFLFNGTPIMKLNDKSTIYVKSENGINDINGLGIVTTKIKKEINVDGSIYVKYYKIFLNQDFQNYTEVKFTIDSKVDPSTIYRILPNVELAARKFEKAENMGMQIKPVRIPLASGLPLIYSIPPGGYVIFEVPDTARNL